MSSFSRRRERLLNLIADQDVEALVVTSRPNVRYLSGFTGEGYLLLTSPPVVCTDRRYEVEACEQTDDCEAVCTEKSHFDCIVAVLRDRGLKQVGFEAESLTYAQHQTLTEGLPEAELVPTHQLADRLRRRKDPEEIALIARAAALVDEVMKGLLPELKPGCTEKQLAWDFRRAVVDAGAEDASFDPLVASGPNAALPHATVTDRRLREGDMVIMDVGARVEGYCSDMTRTVVIGEPWEEFCQRYRVVLEAQEAGQVVAVAGRPTREVDEAARQVLVAAGLGSQFSHSLGHGVGLEVHEGPNLSRHSEHLLEVGNVFTIEPGIYLKGWGGIRIEDLFVLEEDGLRQLTATPKLSC